MSRHHLTPGELATGDQVMAAVGEVARELVREWGRYLDQYPGAERTVAMVRLYEWLMDHSTHEGCADVLAHCIDSAARGVDL